MTQDKSIGSLSTVGCTILQKLRPNEEKRCCGMLSQDSRGNHSANDSLCGGRQPNRSHHSLQTCILLTSVRSLCMFSYPDAVSGSQFSHKTSVPHHSRGRFQLPNPRITACNLSLPRDKHPTMIRIHKNKVIGQTQTQTLFLWVCFGPSSSQFGAARLLGEHLTYQTSDFWFF